MNNMISKLLFTVVLLFVWLPASNANAASRWEYEGINYRFDDEGTLTISGNGEIAKPELEMYNYIRNLNAKKLVIEDGITAIGDWAFLNCETIEEAEIPDSVTSIGERAFESCASLKSIVIPENVTSIENQTFFYCRSLESVTLPETLESIGDKAFQSCGEIKSINIPGNVSFIGKSAFEGCVGLQSMIIPDKVNVINDRTFTYCRNLSDVKIPDTVTSIGESAFCGCTALESILIPDSVTVISKTAFSGCSGLKSILIPENVTSIGWQAFYGCESLESIVIPEGVTSISGGVFCKCTNLKNVIIPDNVKSIESGAFLFCPNLENITIPEKLEDIGERAFEGCTALKRMVLPDGLKKIGQEAFKDCTGLESMTIPDSVTKIGDNAFEGLSDGFTLRGHAGTEAQKYAASNQVKFRIICITHTIIIEEARPATHFETGLTEGRHCMFCGEVFAEQEVIPVLPNPFKDVGAGKYYEESILYLLDRKAMTGFNADTFGVDHDLLREDMVTLIWKIEGYPIINVSVKPFPDVLLGKYYTNPIAWAKKNTIVNGYDSGFFGCGDSISRQDFIKIIYGYARYKGYDTDVKSATAYREKADAKSVSGYARESMNWGYEKGLIGQGSDLRPKENITRQDAAMIIARFLKKFDEEN